MKIDKIKILLFLLLSFYSYSEEYVENNEALITEEQLLKIINDAKKAPQVQNSIEYDKNKITNIKKDDNIFDQNSTPILAGIEKEIKKFDFTSKSEIDHSTNMKIKEITSDKIIKNTEIGVGVAYKSTEPKKDERWEKVHATSSNSTPIYATGKINISQDENSTKYIKVNLGYSIADFNDDNSETVRDRINNTKQQLTKEENGIYYGVGGGIDYKDVSFGLMYQMNRNNGENGRKPKDNERVTFSVDYKLGE